MNRRADIEAAVNWLLAGPQLYDAGREVLTRNVDGEPVSIIVPVIPDDGSARLKEAIARVRIIAITSRCPCGAAYSVPSLTSDHRAVYQALTCHGDECDLAATGIAGRELASSWWHQ